MISLAGCDYAASNCVSQREVRYNGIKQKGSGVDQQCGQRIMIVGSSGSGKTTLAKKIAAALGIPHIELDALYWQENWKRPPPERFCGWVSDALQGERWVVDGNHTEVRDITWTRADTLIWLDYPLRVVFSRLGRRTFKRLIKRQLLLNKNRKTWREQYLTRHSMFFTMLKTY